MIDTRWFDVSTLNFAQNLLRPAFEIAGQSAQNTDSDPLAIIACDEQGREIRITRCGISKGDRVAAVLPNILAAIIGMLAASVIGAVWSCCAPDFDIDAICDRFKLKVLITADTCSYHGKPIALLDHVRQCLPRLESAQTFLVADVTTTTDKQMPFVSFDEVCAKPPADFKFARLPFNHPLYIMYSSGTTGVPKCIIHGQGGTLLLCLLQAVVYFQNLVTLHGKA